MGNFLNRVDLLLTISTDSRYHFQYLPGTQRQPHKQFLWADAPRFGGLVAANLKTKYRALTDIEAPAPFVPP